MKSKRFIFRESWFWSIAVLLSAFALIWQIFQGPWILEDSHEYLNAARNLSERGILYAGDWEEPQRIDDYTKRPIVYPAILALIDAHSSQKILLYLLQAMLSIGSIWLISTLVKNRLKMPPPWFLWSILLILTPSQWIYPSLVMTEILFQALLLGVGISLWQGIGENSLKPWWFGTGCILLAIFTKPVWYLFAVIWLCFGTWKTIRQRQVSYVLIAILPMLSVLGYMNWNKARTGHFHFSSIQNLSLLQYTTTNLLVDVYGEKEGIHKADSILYLSLSQPDYHSEQALLQSACFTVIGDNLGAYTRMHIKGVANFFLDPGRFDLWSFFQLPPPETGFLQTFSEKGYAGILNGLLKLPLGWLLFLMLVLLANLVKITGLLFFLWNRRMEAIGLVVLILFGYLAGLTGTSGASRFALPLFPWMLLCTTSLIQTKGSRKNQGV